MKLMKLLASSSAARSEGQLCSWCLGIFCSWVDVINKWLCLNSPLPLAAHLCLLAGHVPPKADDSRLVYRVPLRGDVVHSYGKHKTELASSPRLLVCSPALLAGCKGWRMPAWDGQCRLGSSPPRLSPLENCIKFPSHCNIWIPSSQTTRLSF